MAALTPEQKLYVVTRLACFDTYSMVQKGLKEKFGVTVVKHQNLEVYDPGTVMGKRLSKELKAVFEATRKKLLKGQMETPIANKHWRLMTLNRLVLAALEKGNTKQATELMEQAAKETGEAFTNRHRLNVRGTLTTPAQELTDAQLVQGLARYGIHATLPGATAATGMAAQPASDDEGGGNGPLH